MTAQAVGTRRPASLTGGVTAHAGHQVTCGSSRMSMTRRSQYDPAARVRPGVGRRERSPQYRTRMYVNELPVSRCPRTARICYA